MYYKACSMVSMKTFKTFFVKETFIINIISISKFLFLNTISKLAVTAMLWLLYYLNKKAERQSCVRIVCMRII